MGHFEVDNRTPFAFEALFLADESGRPILVTVIRATFDLARGREPAIAEVQHRVNLPGEIYAGGTTYKHEPEAAFVKLATDIVLVGHAFAPRSGVSDGIVRFEIGPVSKTIRVIGDRAWVRSMGAIGATKPQPFEKIPLRYELAFGGWDRSDPAAPRCEARNPVGVGYRVKGSAFQEGMLPNLEDPEAPLEVYGQTPPPAGFGFLSPGWQPRAAFAGTYDDRWLKNRMPLLPEDFDRRFFNAASPGLVAPGYLKGDEPVAIVGASPSGAIAFRLPGVKSPRCRVGLALGQAEILETKLDTVVVDADDGRLFMTWRAHLPLKQGPHDIRGVEVGALSG